MGILLGCIADDLTGATDLADILTRESMRTLVVNGPDRISESISDYDCVVVALKSRTCPVEEAVRLSVSSLGKLVKLGAKNFYFKYCSTFDSTAHGNIGPVADALLTHLGSDFSIVSPALPENGRTVYRGHLFVNGVLLSESGMRNHPITPMRDSRLDCLLQTQTDSQIAKIEYDCVSKGVGAIQNEMEKLRGKAVRYAVVDALNDVHLRDIATASADLPLLTGSSGLAVALPSIYRARKMLADNYRPVVQSFKPGYAAIVAGSCSTATRQQIGVWSEKHFSIFLQAERIAKEAGYVNSVVNEAVSQLTNGPVLVYASANPMEVERVQKSFGPGMATMVEGAIATIAERLVTAGVTKLVVAGGETSGAVVERLTLSSLAVGREIAPGVPWMFELADRALAIALKSGNFGDEKFFLKALECADST